MLPSPADREASSGGRPPPYLRRRPERTLLYQLVEEYYPAFEAHLAAQGRDLPGYVRQECDVYLKCGRLEHGFLRVRCESCHAEHLVVFSCKRRGFCPSCGARRMAESAALLVDEVFPEVVNGSVDGCSVYDSGSVRSSVRFGNNFAICDGWQDDWAYAAKGADVALVVIGAWDVFDLQQDDGTYVFGTPEWDALFTANLNEGLDAMARELEIPAPPKPAWFWPAIAITAFLALFTGVSLYRRGASGWAWLFWGAVFTIIFGFFIDQQHGASHTLFAFSSITPWLLVPMFGIAFSLVPAAMWPALPLIVEEKRLGTAFGLTYWMQNLWWWAMALAAAVVAAGGDPTTVR